VRVNRAAEGGFEASFLVLNGNPIQDSANVKTIDMRIKQGVVLSPAE
jgi:imidazolonepropionase-like amidohydrolase